jgi:cell division protein FtsZ
VDFEANGRPAQRPQDPVGERRGQSVEEKMTINLSIPVTHELKPKITVVGVGGAGGNAVNNMITSHLEGVEFIGCNTDAQALSACLTERKIQLGQTITHGLGAGARPEVGRAAAEEALDEILDQLQGSHMVFITAGMGGGTGTGAAPVIAKAVREQGILTVAVVTKPFHFEGAHRMRIAESGLEQLQDNCDTLIIIPNQNLFRLANERTTFAEAFQMADQVLHMGVRGVTDLMMMPGLINLDFADIRTVMSEMGKAMMGTGEGEGERRAIDAAEAAISNPLLDEVSMKGAAAVLINITGGMDMTLFEVDAAANRIREEVDPNANIIFGSTFHETMKGRMRVSVVATGIAQGERVARQAAAAEQAAEAVRTSAVPGHTFRFQQQPVRSQAQPATGRSATRAAEPYPVLPIRPSAERPAAAATAPATMAAAEEDAPARPPLAEAAEERTPNLFERMKGLALVRQAGHAMMRPHQPPAPINGRERPLAGEEVDEIGDIPAFLRRERVDAS